MLCALRLVTTIFGGNGDMNNLEIASNLRRRSFHAMRIHRRFFRRKNKSAALFAFVLCVAVGTVPVVAALSLERIRVPAGFSISVFATGVPNARQVTRSSKGIVYVGTRSAGAVYAVVDEDADYRADRVHKIADGLYMPSGVAYRNGTLYVAEVNRVLAFDEIDQRLDSPPEPRVVFDRLPQDSHHGWKFIAFGPDGKLYVPVGSPCNVCIVADPYGTILRLNLPDNNAEVVARGIRNSVGFAWHPFTGELWFTDNGRDNMGDDTPPGELNRITKSGLHFGFPYIHGDDIVDVEYDKDAEIEFVKPALKLDAHVAPLGPLFYTGTQFPEAYRHDLFIAEHGSWNRSRKSGYRIMRVRFDSGGNITHYEPFATGWLVGQSHWGRPVDLEQMPDGSILVSDDYAGVLYRISYGETSGAGSE